MPDKPFVINDRRKFTADGELRPEFAQENADRASSADQAAAPEPGPSGPQLVPEPTQTTSAPPEPIAFPGNNATAAAHGDASAEQQEDDADQLPPPPTPEQTEQANRAYAATVDRLDTAVRAMDPGAQHAPPMTFDRLVQSLYMQTLIQLGGAPEPNQPVRVDLMGARATIDMLAIIADKTRGNLSEDEDKLVQSALFELRLGFLDVTQALAQQAAQRQPGAGGMGGPAGMGAPGGPSLIR